MLHFSLVIGYRRSPRPYDHVLNLDAARLVTAVVVPTLSQIVKPPIRATLGGDLKQARQQSALEL